MVKATLTRLLPGLGRLAGDRRASSAGSGPWSRIVASDSDPLMASSTMYELSLWVPTSRMRTSRVSSNPCRSPGGVQDAGTVGVFGPDDGQSDLALEGGVVAGPALEITALPRRWRRAYRPPRTFLDLRLAPLLLSVSEAIVVHQPSWFIVIA